jgi:Leucine-rich repeat (LRR) protein
MHETLEVLDLDSNEVDDLEQVDQLGTCFALTTLNLENNPIHEVVSYRSLVLHCIPHLQVLDDEDVVDSDRIVVTDAMLDAASPPRKPKFAPGSSVDSERSKEMHKG